MRRGGKPRTAEFLSYVEAIPMEVLSTIDMDWETVPQYMDKLDKSLGVNTGTLIGHTPVRYYVMGDECQKREATTDEIKSMQDVVNLFITGDAKVTENFLLVRRGASGLDISDQFGFVVDVVAPPGGGFPPNAMQVDAAIRMLLDIVRPAHTLFRLRYIMTDVYQPNGGKGVLDSERWRMSNYYYDDFRNYWEGIRDRDRLGMKTNHQVVGESHSDDF